MYSLESSKHQRTPHPALVGLRPTVNDPFLVHCSGAVHEIGFCDKFYILHGHDIGSFEGELVLLAMGGKACECIDFVIHLRLYGAAWGYMSPARKLQELRGRCMPAPVGEREKDDDEER